MRAQSPQANAAVRPPRPSKPVSPPISQAVPEAEPVEITAVETQVAKDNLTVAMSPVETLATGIPDQRLTEAALIARGRAREYSAIEVTTDVPSTRISSDPTTADRQPESTTGFVHLMAVLAVDIRARRHNWPDNLKALRVLGDQIEQDLADRSALGSIRPKRGKPVPSKFSEVPVMARHTDVAGVTETSIVPQLSDWGSEIEASVRRLIHELQRREHQPRDFQPNSRKVAV